jgi:hypothetical protein
MMEVAGLIASTPAFCITCTELACPIMGVPTATGLRPWGRASPVAQSERYGGKARCFPNPAVLLSDPPELQFGCGQCTWNGTGICTERCPAGGCQKLGWNGEARMGAREISKTPYQDALIIDPGAIGRQGGI